MPPIYRQTHKKYNALCLFYTALRPKSLDVYSRIVKSFPNDHAMPSSVAPMGPRMVFWESEISSLLKLERVFIWRMPSSMEKICSSISARDSSIFSLSLSSFALR